MTSEASTDRVQRDPEKLYEVSEWRVSRVGDLVQIINGYPFDSAGFSSEGWPLIRIRDLNQEVTETHFNGSAVAAAIVTQDDVLVGMDGDFNVGRWKSTEPAMLNQRMLALRGPSDLLTVLKYALERPLREINDTTYATTVKHLSSGQVRAIRVRLPSNPKDISALAVFLDRETGEIDAFIRDQEELIGLLRERRAATISHAVTKGLDPDAPLIDSGSEWLGPIPSHWSVVTLRRVLGAIEQGVSPQAEAGPAGEGETGVLKSGCVNGGVFRESEQKKLPDDFLYPSSLVVRPGDLLMNRASGSIRLLGSAALVDDLSSKLILSDKTFRLRPLPSVASARFLNALLNATPIRRQIESSVSGAEGLANNLPMASIRRLVVAMPSLKEQLEIADYLRDALQEVDLMIADAGRAVVLSRERRSALISAAVTGKIDVRERVEV